MSKNNPKQLALFDTVEVRAVDLDTDSDIQERHRLRAAQKTADEQRHERWLKHNTTQRMNLRDCPCEKCKKMRRQQARSR